MVPPCTTHRDGCDVIDLIRLARTSGSLDLASVIIALKYLEPDLLPRAGVPRLPSHASHLWLANVQRLVRRPRGRPPRVADSRAG